MNKPHLHATHEMWKKLLCEEDLVIDATAGNGRDTLCLARLVLRGGVYAIDNQEVAIRKTRFLLNREKCKNVRLYHMSHTTFPKEIANASIKLIVYNLGYLPSGDKTKTTKVSSTLQSVANALPLITASGAISITCYPGHEEGEKEEKALLEFAAALNPTEWSVAHTQWINRVKSPSVLFFQKSETARESFSNVSPRASLQADII